MRFKISNIKNKTVRILFIIGSLLNASMLVLLPKIVNSDYFLFFLALEIVTAVFIIRTIFSQLLKKEEKQLLK